VRTGVVVLVIWLVIGAVAGGQRGYYNDSAASCASVSDTVLTIVAGPLNYVGVNPKVSCTAPQPSK
jgi:hypothetical protein